MNCKYSWNDAHFQLELLQCLKMRMWDMSRLFSMFYDGGFEQWKNWKYMWKWEWRKNEQKRLNRKGRKTSLVNSRSFCEVVSWIVSSLLSSECNSSLMLAHSAASSYSVELKKFNKLLLNTRQHHHHFSSGTSGAMKKTVDWWDLENFLHFNDRKKQR